jgi:tetratricopeptide (TPR) repeat protein
MLQSKFSRKSSGFKAQKIFTDRVEPRSVFRTSIQTLGEKPQEIITYYGKGGIGKSSLLKTLYTQAQDVYDTVEGVTLHSIFVSLDAYDFANPVNILMAIRNGVTGDCGLFDYAMLQYCAKAKLNVEEIMQKNSVLSSPVMGVLNELISLGTASACIPTATIQKCVNLIKDHKLRAQYKDDIEEMATLNEFEIFERLPYYLGLCLSYAAEKGHCHVIFLDSYESLLARTEYGTFSVEREEWLQELFLSSQVIRLVIGSRDRLRWDREDPEWGTYLQQHLLNNLSEEDSRWFLHQVPIRDESVVETIVSNAGGVPLYLDMCVSLYESDINAGKPFEMTSAQNGEKIITRYIRHLSPKDKNAIKSLAAPQFFDLPFARSLLQKQQVVYEEDELKQLLEKSIFLPLDESRGVWKVDESVRLHQKADISPEKMTSVLGSMLDCVLEQPEGKNYPHLALVLETVCGQPEILPPLLEKALQAVELFANLGFWGELHTQLAPQVESIDKPLQALAVLEETIYLRRTGRLQAAFELVEAHPLDKELLGSWYYMYAYLRVQIRHLLGYYDESLAGYQALVQEMDLIRPLIPDHVYLAPCMKYADLLFLKGRFQESLALVKKLLQENTAQLADQIELLRIEGHIYRFQQQYAEAELIYRSALTLAQEHDMRACLGKLYTNMTEVLCVRGPEQALEWFQKARDAHTATENGVELGKALAAASAAQTALGRLEEGISLGRQAVETAEKTGYLSGKAFGLTVLCYAYRQAGQTQALAATKAELRQVISRIGVYEYLLERVEA